MGNCVISYPTRLGFSDLNHCNDSIEIINFTRNYTQQINQILITKLIHSYLYVEQSVYTIIYDDKLYHQWFERSIIHYNEHLVLILNYSQFTLLNIK